ncbi:endonuclease/exonuclease/phosphatase family protein [Stieleria varia]|uniref:Endonuclease/Exonuclease/phosphatase family protein n=1 Tax=Stieleria varia TaxID=2528005 RepID=A0A5C6A3S9_9BACT|nr:endonuclease/exonuclease/phosphatase family protein [Stieleria varia]TWT93918.1 Endonuclease/Exonuclease/phosphatase family protein [Stieleria varia]
MRSPALRSLNLRRLAASVCFLLPGYVLPTLVLPALILPALILPALILPALILPALILPANVASAADAEPFSIMTWNLEWFYDDFNGDNFSDLAKEMTTPSRAQWDWRRDAIAQSIATASPSVVALQEVENRRVLWYLSRALDREHKQKYTELNIESTDHFTEQDVGFLFRSPLDVLSISQRMQTRQMKASEQYFNLSKHLVGVFEVPLGNQTSGGQTETVIVLNVHLRAKAEAEALRIRQAKLIHYWVASAVAAGENVIVLGDFNTEETGDVTRPDSDLGVACGLHTPQTSDDLVDLHSRIRSPARDTHLLSKSFDRILVSPSLLTDTPGKPDLVFDSITVRQDLVIRGARDTPSQHWDDYWGQPDSDRDLSDHYPVIAKFNVR